MLRFLVGFVRGLTGGTETELLQSDQERPQFNATPHIREAVLGSGLTKGRESDLAFYLDAHADGQLNGREVRKRGKHRLSTDEKRAAGITHRGVLTEEFLATLNERGLAEPEAAAWMIASPATHRAMVARDLAGCAAIGVNVEFLPSVMAAGPCSKAACLAGKRYAADAAPLVPFAECPHPDQCACMYQARLSLDGGF